MLSIALDTLRTRWAGFVGTFVGLALGVGLLAAVGIAMTGALNGHAGAPLRYAAAPVVVSPATELDVVSPDYTDHLPLGSSPGLAPELVARVRATGPTTVDRSFYAQATGEGPAPQAPAAGQPLGHPWSAAAFTPYRLTAGAAPADARQVVLGGGRAELVGRQVTVLTAQGPAPYTVSGVTAPVSFEQAVFFSDDEAARLSPRVDALVVHGPADAVRAAVAAAGGTGRVKDGIAVGTVRVLTGDARHDGDTTKADDEKALQSVNGLLGVAGGLAAFVAVFVTASTFAFSVSQRRRELAVLRSAGATPRQVATMVLAEATVVGTLASAVGALLGVPGGPLLARWLVSRGQAPAWYQVSFSAAAVAAVVAAFATGVTVAVCGAGLACFRAGRIRPIEALREAAVDRKPMTVGRWIGGITALVTGLALVVLVPMADPLVAVALNETVAGVLVVAFALLAPLVAGPLVRLITLPLAWLRGASVLLVRENAVAAVRRTAATATPVLVTVGLAAAILGSVGTIDAAKATELRQSTRADYMLVPHGAPGLSQAAVERVRQLPGLDATPVSTENVYGPQPSATLVQYTAQIVDPAQLGQVFDLKVVSGSLDALRDDTVVIDQQWGRRTGDTVDVYLGDGSRASLTVAAVVRTGIGGNAAFLTPAHAQGALVSRVDVRLRPGTDPAAALAGLREAGRGLNATVVPSSRWAAAVNDAQSAHSMMNATTVLLIALVYTGLSIVNTLVMATSARSREFALMRLTGATRRQVLRVVAGESVTVVLVGVALAAAVAAVTLGGLGSTLRGLVGRTPVVVPWGDLGLITAACAAAAVLAAVAAARLSLRTPPVELAGARE
ncbi:FtsX-like permease family protein [Kitasatospora sp. NPDC018619]|uniref:ABC transporter permease n=1 Tax=unclassified Kitasatospora TaxID=2633591 RepID=UPI00378B38A1